MAEETKRNFSMTYNRLTERAGVQALVLMQDLALFTVRFPWLDGAWLAGYQADIAQADNYPTDSDMVLQTTVLTFDLGQAHRSARLALGVLNGYATVRWQRERGLQRQFGQDKWTAAYGKTDKLQEALLLAHTKASQPEVKPELMSKGMTQADIDALQALADELSNKNMMQEMAKTDRRVNTHDRRLLHNGVLDKMSLVAACSKVVFPDNAEKQQQYQVYEPGSKRKSTVVNMLIVQAGQPLAGATVTIGNAPLAPHTTTAEGTTTFTSKHMPPTIDVSITHNGTTWLKEGLTVALRGSTDFTLELEV